MYETIKRFVNLSVHKHINLARYSLQGRYYTRIRLKIYVDSFNPITSYIIAYIKHKLATL